MQNITTYVEYISNSSLLQINYSLYRTYGLQYGDQTYSFQRDRPTFERNTALFQPAFVISARSEWWYPCYTCFYLRIAYDGHCELSLQIELRKVGIGTGKWLGRSA
jgi:hypothetical protein